MDSRAGNALQNALWMIHKMFSDINQGNIPDAQELDSLEHSIVEIEDYLEFEYED
jgi:hypothetical protein